MSLFEGMVHPALAWGALLAVVPLLIHLLNRQRHKPMPWAAMRFVLEAYRRTRRRTRLENLLLLLLRMAAVALLAFAVSRPFTGRESALAVLTESRRDLVLVLDASASTGYVENVGSVFESELERAREILADFDGTRGDRVRLILAGQRGRLLSARAPDEALSMLSTLTAPTSEPLELGVVLGELLGELEGEEEGGATAGLEVRILSDLQRRSFALGGDAPPDAEGEDAAPQDGAPTLADALDRLAELGVETVVEDLGPRDAIPANLGVEAVGPLGTVLGPGIATDVAVRVRNFGAGTRSGVRVALAVDGERLPVREVEIGPRAAAEVVFPVVFREGGLHALEARLEGDRLAADDARATVLHVPPPARVLLVDGAPHEDVEKDEVGYLRVVLEPTDDGALAAGYLPFRVSVRSPAQLSAGEDELGEADVIVLANTGVLSARVVGMLERRVAAGASLILTMGDRWADPSSIEGFNARLWRADGSGLAPARLEVARLSRDRASYQRVAEFDAAHPALAFFGDERWRPLLTEVPIRGYVASQPAPQARVLARLDDREGSPLLIERAYDRGRVFLWTTTIDADWTRIPESPASFVPLVHELVRYAAGPTPERRTAAVGETLAPTLEAFPKSPALFAPDGAREPIDEEPVEVADGVWRLPVLGPFPEPGLWRVETQDGTVLPLAIHLDSEEGDLQRLGAAELEASHRAWRVWDGAEDERSGGEQGPERGELWRWFAGAALAALVAETLWAAWLGRRRQPA